MSDNNDWLQETKARSGLISEAYRPERTPHQERIAAKLEGVTEGAKARLPTRILRRVERMSGVKFYAQSAV